MSSRSIKPAISPIGQRELIVVAKGDAALRASPSALTSAANVDVSSLESVLAKHQAALKPLFDVPEEHLQTEAAALAKTATGDVPNLSVYYNVQAPDANLDALAAELRAHDLVDGAYVKPAGEAPIMAPLDPGTLNDMMPRADDAPPVSPDFTTRQGYLEVAPGGIDARYAWTQAGGGGAGVNIIDCEWAWNLTHEDLTGSQGGVVAGAAGGDNNHGTAVQGEMGGNRNGLGVTGICPDAFRRFAA